MKLSFPPNIDLDTFLAEYWQRKPLLIKNAFPADLCVIDANELAGMASEPDLESRIILEQGGHPWELRHGPFAEDDFNNLPASHWTLLVQDVDKYVDSAREVINEFRFIPDWRIDDLMISFATDKGSVGPHVDSYDVFLIQAAGKRRWRIGLPEDIDEGFVEDADIQLLKTFSTQQEWLVEPGDVLYLPPNLPHWGIAEGECMTCSVGFRAPSPQEMLEDWLQFSIDQAATLRPYRDPQLDPQAHPAKISASAVSQATQTLRTLEGSPDLHRRWFGQLVTQPKAHHEIAPAEQSFTASELMQAATRDWQVHAHPFSRFAYAEIVGSERLALFVNGDEFQLADNDIAWVERICDLAGHPQPLSMLTHCDPTCLQVLVNLLNAGYLIIDE